MDQQVLFEYPEGFQQALDCSLDFLPEEARAEFLIFSEKAAIALISLVSSIGCIVLLVGNSSLIILYVALGMLGIITAASILFPPILTKKLFGERDYSLIYANLSIALSTTGAIGVTIYGLIFDFTKTYRYDFIIVLSSIAAATVFIVAAINSVKALHQAKDQQSTKSV